MTEYIGLDFETYGSVNLPECGLDNYVNDEFFQPLIASLYWEAESGQQHRERVDFVDDFDGATLRLRDLISSKVVVAHNAGFERAVLKSLKLDKVPMWYEDSAVVARFSGAAGKLEAAAPQLLNTGKVETGWELIKLFSIPGDYQERNGSLAFNPDIVRDHPQEWADFKHYCDVDAQLGYQIHDLYSEAQHEREREFNTITMEMNIAGWHVDLDLVQAMQQQYEKNLDEALEEFQAECDPKGSLNLNSLKQLKEWCEARGVKSSSFNEAAVKRTLQRVTKKIESLPDTDDRKVKYQQVEHLLRTKQTLGGSSLKKLDVVLRNTGADGRLRDQYLHCGASQTLRTSGRSVQMQNLKRLGSEPDDVSDITGWTNDELARNLRQIFTATDPNGALIVGDFSSVESRGLAYLADETWKTDAFFAGKDLYKVLASKIYSVDYDFVDKTQRQTGKVGELSCGYGAGPDAVVSFAEGMGVDMSRLEATSLVQDWRSANQKIVDFWNRLDDMLHAVVEGRAIVMDQVIAGGNYVLYVERTPTPDSLLNQHGTAKSICVQIKTPDNTVILQRYFHGCYLRGRNICYYKPSELKSGDLWKQTFINPKTKQEQYYSVYGGKLTGILTQSFCREIFFWVLRNVHLWAKGLPNVELIGQFHDEMVLDWQPDSDGISKALAMQQLERMMSDAGPFKGFPLAAEIKSDYRYTK